MAQLFAKQLIFRPFLIESKMETKIKRPKRAKFFLDKTENIEGKDNKHFLLFPGRFGKPFANAKNLDQSKILLLVRVNGMRRERLRNSKSLLFRKVLCTN